MMPCEKAHLGDASLVAGQEILLLSTTYGENRDNGVAIGGNYNTMTKKPMVYLGATGKRSFRVKMRELGWGLVIINNLYRAKEFPFILDNGAYGAWRNKTEWDGDAFMRMVDKVEAAGRTPDFVVLPDIVGGGARSIELSISWIDRLPPGWPKALASQDGQTFQELMFAMSLSGVSVWFLGGTNAHKLMARDYCKAAHRLGKKFHFARCSTLERLDFAMHIGVDSVDTVNPLNDKTRFCQYIDAWENGHPQSKLFHRGDDDLRSPFDPEEFCPCGGYSLNCRCGVDG
jgi:hypothetical protein